MSDAGHPAPVRCRRCLRPDAPALARPPLPGPAGEEIRAQVCSDCWGDWQRMEVKVINELRLNFMDPQALQILDAHLREFLALDSSGAAPGGAPPSGG